MKTKLDQKIITGDLRDGLKEFVKNEIQKLPDTLKNLEQKDRLNILLKLIPYVLPRVDSVSHTEGEPWNI